MDLVAEMALELCNIIYEILKDEILHLAPLGVKPLRAHIRGAII